MLAHIDADAFFASALQRKRPDLKGKPLLALGMGGGCVIAASYEAKACGVKTGMRLSEARKLCKGAIALPSDFDEALLASRQIEQILKNRCPIIQRYSVDEWFLDLKSLTGGLPDNIKHWALELQETVKRSVDLTVSIGIGPSKLLAKMASEYVKPEGVTIIFRSSIDTFLRDRSAEAIPGIGRRRALHTEAQGWKTAYDIAYADKEKVQKLFGRPGLAMQRELLGEMVEKIETEIPLPKSISRTRSFLPTRDRAMVYAHLLHHLTYTMLKMRRLGLATSVVSVWLRSDAYTFDQKENKLPQAADTEEQVLPYVHQCFDRLYEQGSRYTQVGLGLYGLNPKGGTQYSLFENPKNTQEVENIQAAMDDLHKKYGRESIKRGSAMAVNNAKKPHLEIIE
ncbi:MAG: DNA polymerase IV [bacterium]|nr:DNA polymerase IV [bacterium]MDA1292742.1 DNA polymerase IV [bacterium]